MKKANEKKEKPFLLKYRDCNIKEVVIYHETAKAARDKFELENPGANVMVVEGFGGIEDDTQVQA